MSKFILLSLSLLALVAHAEEPPKSEWTFETRMYSLRDGKFPFGLGLVKPERGSAASMQKVEAFKAAGEIPKAVDLSTKYTLSPVKNQGSCGSCVYFASHATLEDMYRIRGVELPKTAPQYTMDCLNRDWMCNGSFFSKVAGGIVKSPKGVAKEADYPYRASNQSCRATNPELVGPAKSWKLIEPNAQSMFAALATGYPVAITVGAGGSWMNYSSGVFNACSSVGTNHQIELVGYDCETSVDAAGNCKFDANGNLPAGVGTIKIKNSWGDWGDQGYMVTKLTDGRGRKCNNITEEAGIFEVELPDPKPPTPPGPTPGPDFLGVPKWAWIVMGILAAIAGVFGFLVFKKK